MNNTLISDIAKLLIDRNITADTFFVSGAWPEYGRIDAWLFPKKAIFCIRRHADIIKAWIGDKDDIFRIDYILDQFFANLLEARDPISKAAVRMNVRGPYSVPDARGSLDAAGPYGVIRTQYGHCPRMISCPLMDDGIIKIFPSIDEAQACIDRLTNDDKPRGKDRPTYRVVSIGSFSDAKTRPAEMHGKCTRAFRATGAWSQYPERMLQRVGSGESGGRKR
jgi:hypothetical protein